MNQPAPPPPPARRPVSPRQAFDELLRRKVDGMMNPAIAAGPVGQGKPSPRVEEAEHLLATYREFADAVDRTDSDLPYGDAVVILGSGGVVVCTGRDYATTPIYWESLAGEVDLIIDGGLVMQTLHT